MKKVITYGTYDLFHQGHINLLQRAKALGDYLIVGVTNDNFDRERGKLNVRNNVLERVEAVRATGLADKIVIEDYVGQKIDDIQKYDVDIFTVGSDWEGYFDYLREYCEVVYLPRTEGISSTMLREGQREVVRIGIAGAGRIARRFVPETHFVDAVEVTGVYDVVPEQAYQLAQQNQLSHIYESYEAMVADVDAVYIATPHLCHYEQARYALQQGRHVLCETPMVLSGDEARELYQVAEERQLVLLEANKTAFCPAFNHLVTLIKSGLIGDVVDVEASESKVWGDPTLREFDPEQAGGSFFEMGSYPLLPIIRLLGTQYTDVRFYTKRENGIDVFTKGILQYPHAVSTFKLGLGVKTEGNLVVSGTRGYAYVPAPWWKTDYFELRYEDQNQNKKYFYKWDGEGLRYEIREFVAGILNHRLSSAYLRRHESIAMADLMQQFATQKNIAAL
ncbi:MAG: Gfo/Idh/MocA family oxidoreductase [Prevotella sp.]|nr:Gfo/Idh/MocA family oxidoreductase [Prevotella sp.]